MNFEKSFKYDTQINPSANGGFIVQIGCCSLVFKDCTSMFESLLDIYLHPEQSEKEYNQREQCKGGTPELPLRRHGPSQSSSS